MTDWEPPAYAWRCKLGSGISGAASIVSLCLTVFVDGADWAPYLGVLTGLAAIVGIAATIICVKLDRNYKCGCDLSERLPEVVGEQVAKAYAARFVADARSRYGLAAAPHAGIFPSPR